MPAGSTLISSMKYVMIEVYMPRRTTVVLEDDVYEKLVRESMRKYRTPRAISKVINDILRKVLSRTDEVIELLYSERYARVTLKEVEELRRELSEELEER